MENFIGILAKHRKEKNLEVNLKVNLKEEKRFRIKGKNVNNNLIIDLFKEAKDNKIEIEFEFDLKINYKGDIDF